MKLKPPKKNPLYLLDLHIHSKYSPDSISEPKSIAKVARLRGINVIAVTDHNTIRGGLETKEYESDDLKVIVGSEIKTLSGEIIGLFLHKEIPKNLNAIETIKRIHRQGGLAVIPHPFDTVRKNSMRYLDKDTLNLIDGIEVLNVRSIARSNLTAQEFAYKHKLKFTAGSDAHTLLEIGGACLQSGSKKLDSDEEIKKVLSNTQFDLYTKPISPFVYRPFDILGRQVKRRNLSKAIADVLNRIQESISIFP